ncbi:MAG: acyl-CoA oxidase, partial [Dermatophilaceae bacterium]
MSEDRSALTLSLQRHLDGPRGALRDQARQLDGATFGHPATPLPMSEHRARVTAQLRQLATGSFPADGFPERQGGTGRYGDSVTAFEMLGHLDLSLFVKAGVQWGLFGGAVSLLGTDRHNALLPQIISGEVLGCFA